MLVLVNNTYCNILVTPISKISEIPIKYSVKDEYYINKLPRACDIKITNVGVYFDLLIDSSLMYHELVIYNITEVPVPNVRVDNATHICSKALYNYVCESLATGIKELVLPIL